MKHDIDLFHGHPFDHRWDMDRNARLLNIVFHVGTFGNFLRFFLDKFSKLSPDLPGDLFTDIGTSHLDESVRFSGLVQRYHSHFINDNKDQTDLPVCIIVPSTKKHFLYLKKAQQFRVGDKKNSPDDLWIKDLGEMDGETGEHARRIIKLYNIKGMNHFGQIPKFIVRDWYKLEFLLDLDHTFNYQWYHTLKNHPFFEKQKVFHLDLETFFNWNSFVKNITELNDVFALDLDFDRLSEMRELFERGLELDNIRKECNLIQEFLEFGTDCPLNGLDVTTEAFIYAEFERKNPDILMPLTNKFFGNTKEIKQFIEHFPNWYRRPNPNLG